MRNHLPAYTLLDSWRDTFREGFFLESEYYLALARYKTLTTDGFKKAVELAQKLHNVHLAGAVPRGLNAKRYSELRILAQCLELNCIMRILLSKDDDKYDADPIVRFNSLKREIVPTLRDVAIDPKWEASVRASILCTLGLIQRLDRKPQLVNRAESLLIELDFFLKALDLDRSPDTCFYLAEVLLELQRHAEAQLYVEVALGLCATHAGALALRDNLGRIRVTGVRR